MIPEALEALLFDAGGTLVRLDYAFIGETAEAAGERVDAAGLANGEAAARRRIDRAARAAGQVEGRDASRVEDYFEALLCGAGVEAGAAPRIAGLLVEAHRADNLWRVPLPGAADTLRRLRLAGRRTAVVSNADGRVAGILERAGLAEHLELIVDSHHEGVEKPDPEIFRRALERLGVAAERAAYIGDIYSIDAVGARAAGIAPLILDVTGGYGELDCPTLAALPELLTLIGEHPGHSPSEIASDTPRTRRRG